MKLPILGATLLALGIAACTDSRNVSIYDTDNDLENADDVVTRTMDRTEEGLERAGRKADQALNRAGDAIDRTVERAGEGLQRAGDEIDRTFDRIGDTDNNP